MRVLVACEFSGIVRDAFIARGHDAISCDLLPTEKPGPHYQGDVLDLLLDKWDLMIAHPPCTFLTVTGNKWFKKEYASRFPNRAEDRENAIRFFTILANAPIAKKCIENPVGIMSTIYRKPDQIIQPYEYGEPFSKKTCLWLTGLPLLIPTNIVDKGERVVFKSGKSMPKWYSELRGNSHARSKTFQGIASAMAEQWG